MEVSHRQQAVIEGWEQDYLAVEEQRQEVCALAREGDVGQLVARGFPADMAQIMCDWQRPGIPDVVGSFLHPESLDVSYIYGLLNAADLQKRLPELRVHLLHLDSVGYRKHSESPFNFGSFGSPHNMFGVVEVGKAAVANSALYAPRSYEDVSQRAVQFSEVGDAIVRRIFSQLEPYIENAIHAQRLRHRRKEIKAWISNHLRQNHADLDELYQNAVAGSVESDDSIYMSQLLHRYKAAVSRQVLLEESSQSGISESLFSADRLVLPLVRHSIRSLIGSRGVDFLRQVAEPGEGLCLMAPRNVARQMLVMGESGQFKVVGDGQERLVGDDDVAAILEGGLPLAKLFVVAMVASGSVYHLGSEQAERMRDKIIDVLGVAYDSPRQYLRGLHMGENGGYANKGVKLKNRRSFMSLPMLYLLLGPRGLREFVAIRQGNRADPLELSAKDVARLASRHLVSRARDQLFGQEPTAEGSV